MCACKPSTWLPVSGKQTLTGRSGPCFAECPRASAGLSDRNNQRRGLPSSHSSWQNLDQKESSCCFFGFILVVVIVVWLVGFCGFSSLFLEMPPSKGCLKANQNCQESRANWVSQEVGPGRSPSSWRWGTLRETRQDPRAASWCHRTTPHALEVLTHRNESSHHSGGQNSKIAGLTSFFLRLRQNLVGPLSLSELQGFAANLWCSLACRPIT